MSLKETWTDKVNGRDVVDAEDINAIAEAVIELEKNGGGVGTMDTISALDSTDFFLVYDLPEKSNVRISWQSLRGIIQEHLERKLTALAVADEVGSGYKATIRELEKDTTLLTAQDIPSIVNQVVDSFPAAEEASF